MLRGSTDWATEHHRPIAATGLNFSWGELTHPSQVDGYMPLGIRPASSPLNSLTLQDFPFYKVSQVYEVIPRELVQKTYLLLLPYNGLIAIFKDNLYLQNIWAQLKSMLCLILFQCHKYSSLIFRQSSRFIAVIISRVRIRLCLLVYLWSTTQKIFYEQHILFNFERKKYRLNVHFSVPENTFSSWWCAVEYTGSQQWTVTLCMCFYIIKRINHRWLYYLRQLLSVGLASIFMHCCSEDGSALFLPVEKTTYFQRRPISKGPFQSLTITFFLLFFIRKYSWNWKENHR